MKLIESKTLATAAASIEFTSIPQDATDLVVLMSLATTNTDKNIYIRFNGSTTSYSFKNLLSIGSGSGISQSASSTSGGQIGGMRAITSNTFANAQAYIPNYTGSTNKSYSAESVSESNSADAYLFFVAGLWSNTAAITTLTIFEFTGDNLLAGSTASLYKITKGSDGIVTTS
jgi:hypothetical protein